MHPIRLADIHGDRDLSVAVLQIGQMLGFYNAELARILGIKCADVDALNKMRQFIEFGSETGERARMLVRFFEVLFDIHQGDEIAIYHWLRRRNESLDGQPLLLLVDEGRIGEVINHLSESLAVPQKNAERRYNRRNLP